MLLFHWVSFFPPNSIANPNEVMQKVEMYWAVFLIVVTSISMTNHISSNYWTEHCWSTPTNDHTQITFTVNRSHCVLFVGGMSNFAQQTICTVAIWSRFSHMICNQLHLRGANITLFLFFRVFECVCVCSCLFQPTKSSNCSLSRATFRSCVSYLVESMKNDEIMRWTNKVLDPHTHTSTD